MSIRCYKNYTKPVAIGFDLDDTLYDNRPVLLRAEHQLNLFLHHHFPLTQQYSRKNWLSLRHQVITDAPSLLNDTSASRLAALSLGLTQLGYGKLEADDGAAQAFEEFLVWRNKVVISDKTHQLLAQLQKKFRLFVISNGNADVTRLGLAPYFEFALHPSVHIAMKPEITLFQQAQQRLDIAASSISYVGDHPISDVFGANNAGWQSIWFNPTSARFDHYKKPLQLPTIEVSSLSELMLLD